MSIILTLLIFGVLVLVHEGGHFLMAKKNGICVLEFSIGMGPALLSKQIGETQYSLRVVPFGGFCRMLDEDGETEGCNYGKEGSFQEKSVGARFAVVVAGVVMNFALAFLLIFGLVSTSAIFKPEISNLVENAPAKQVGMEIGDTIEKINGKRIYIYSDLEILMGELDGSPISVETKRNGKVLEYTITPTLEKETGLYKIGFYPVIHSGIFAERAEGIEKATFLETAKESFETMIFYIRYTAMGLTKAFTFQLSKEEIAGPIGMVQITEDSYEAGLKYGVSGAIRNMVYLAAVLSANLGVMNLLPIPGLDGGRIIFLIVEAIRRRPIDPQVEGRFHMAGFFLLIGFMIFVAWNDVLKLLG